jgi:hypothetical protein
MNVNDAQRAARPECFGSAMILGGESAPGNVSA